MKGRLEPFNYRGVSLDPGLPRRQLDEVKDYYLAIPNDDLLKGFRGRAGLPAPGHDLGGWYSSDTFHVFGQIVSGLARLYAATGDPACRSKVSALVEGWARCIAADGYFYASAKPNAPHYIYDKTVWGLLDAYLYCGNREALAHLSRITDWAVLKLDRSRRTADTSTEWYTLSENLYRAYLATGDKKYRDFAAVWEYPEYWNLYERRADPFAVRPSGQRNDAYHAYSHVNTLGGAGAAYRATGKPVYLDILRNAYDYLQEHQVLATGGYGPDEQLLPQDVLVRRLGVSQNTFETQCGAWAVFKIVKYLLTLTGDAHYGDWAERVAWNGLFAGIPMTGDGRVFYYSDYNTHGGAKRNCDFGWSCCTGTRPQAVADFCDLMYFHDQGGFYVNLFAPSQVRRQMGEAEVTLRQATRFPADELVEFSITTTQPVEFGLSMRRPGWLAGPMSARLNGKPIELTANPLNWATLRRQWHSGDKLAVKLPMKLTYAVAPALGGPREPPNRTESLQRGRETGALRRYPVAILYGPVVLAARAPDAKFVDKLDLNHLEQCLVPAQGESLTWRLAADSEVLLRPFYIYKEYEPYYLYLDPTAARRISFRKLAYSGKWMDGSSFRYSNDLGATASCEFEGSGIRWLGFRYDDAGMADVSIDGKIVAKVSQFGPGRHLPFDWSYRGLEPGKHTIKLTLREDRVPKSLDRFINVAGFEILEQKPEKR